jgi:hypothetical protein
LQDAEALGFELGDGDFFHVYLSYHGQLVGHSSSRNSRHSLPGNCGSDQTRPKQQNSDGEEHGAGID